MSKPETKADVMPGQKTGYEFLSTGLTKREHFAAMAMQGYIACHGLQMTSTTIAQNAIFAADRLLQILEEATNNE
jgi:hypothetical protein